jgi:hypothetical protein
MYVCTRYMLRLVCMRGMHICIPTGSYLFPCPAKTEIMCKYRVDVLMLLIDQNLTLFPMVYLVFLYVVTYMLKMEVECEHGFGE